MKSCVYTHEDDETGEEWLVRVDFDVDPGERGCHTLPNGDPGWPEIPASICDETYTVVRHQKFDESGRILVYVRNPGPVYDGRFLALVEQSDRLRRRIEQACWESLEPLYECDDY